MHLISWNSQKETAATMETRFKIYKAYFISFFVLGIICHVIAGFRLHLKIESQDIVKLLHENHN